MSLCRIRAAILKAVLRCACLVAAMPCAAAKLALLVGVSQYPGLPAELQLRAPANDVRLLRQVLQPWGFDAAHVQVLADGVEGARLPTHASIVAALRELARQARTGDTVYLHFSGHGSLQSVAQPAGEAPRWQPIFLPRDVSAWDGRTGGAVPNALSDTELRQLVDRINDTGAFVFAVFDACHSARLVRGASTGTDPTLLRVRQVPPSDIGERGDAPPDVRPAWTTADTTADAHRGQAVYFYAAQSVELAAARPLADHGEPAWHGLFSWHVAQALSQGEPMSYRQLAQHVLSRYDLLPDSVATPLFNGDGLDQAVFGQRTILLRQWPLAVEHGAFTVPAGALIGLAEGAVLAVLADPAAPTTADAMQPPQGTLGFMRVAAVQANRASLEPVAWRGWPALAALPPGSWARLMVSPPSFALNVAADRSACPDDCPAARVLSQLRRDGVPGVDVRWAGATEVPDVRLRATPAGVRLLLPGASGDDGFGIAVAAGDPALAIEVMAQQTAAALHRIARTRNLLRLASATPSRSTDLQLTVKWRHAGAGSAATPLSPEQMPALRAGDVVLLEGRNASGDPLDVGIFWLGADQSVQQLYPADRRASARLMAGESLPPGRWAVERRTEGTEHLLVIALPMRKGQEAADFRVLEQSPLARLRGAGDATLQALADACFGDYAERGAAVPALPAERLGLSLFTFQIGR